MLHCLRCLRCLGLALGAPVASVAGTTIGGTEGMTGEIGRIDRAGEVMCAPSRKQYTRTERAALNELVCASVCRCASHKPFHERGIRPRVWKLLLPPIRESCGLFALPVFGPRIAGCESDGPMLCASVPLLGRHTPLNPNRSDGPHARSIGACRLLSTDRPAEGAMRASP